MGTSLLCCVLIAAALCCSVAANNARGPDDCCFEFYPKKVKIDLLKSHYLTDHRCGKAGVIVVTVKNARICMDPELKWVQKIMNALDERRF